MKTGLGLPRSLRLFQGAGASVTRAVQVHWYDSGAGLCFQHTSGCPALPAFFASREGLLTGCPDSSKREFDSHVSVAASPTERPKSEMCLVCKMEQQRQALIMTIVKGEAHDQRAAINN
jgi:hypothetical protein